MFKSYLKIALRNLLKNKGYSFINILGLAIGITCCVLILLFVQDELSFDKFHAKADRIYRLNKVVTPLTGGTELHAITAGQMGPTMVTEYPEVEQCVRALPWFDEVLMTYEEKSFKVPDVVIADSNFFEVFDFQLLRGNPKTALVEPMSMVLSQGTAQKLFGETDPIGKIVIGLNDLHYTVTGIVQDVPPNSHLRYNALISWTSTIPGTGGLNWPWLNRWITQVTFTYLLLSPGANPQALEQKLPDFMQRHLARKADQYHLYLQPLSDIYLKSSKILYTSNSKLGNMTYVYIFSAIAALILLIACINFMNLSTARATKRAREVGVRKVLGAFRTQLARQFLGESILLSLLALILATTLVEVVLPYFNEFTNKALEFDVLNNPFMLWGLLGITFFVGVVSGLYPALALSGFRPVHVLRGIWKGGAKGATPRKILVTLQFAISIALIAGTVIIYQQMRFMQNKNLGFHKGQIVVLPIGSTDIPEHAQAFRNELLRHPNIKHAAGSNSVPGVNMMSFTLRPEGKPEDEDWTAYAIRIDDTALLETYGLELAAGRYFSPKYATDVTNGVVINETLAKSLGWQEPIGKHLDISGELQNGKVIGVVKDFHMKSLHHPIEPMLFYFASRWGNLSLRISGEDIPGTIKFLRKTWQEFDSRHPFEYYFLDQQFAQFYDSEQRLMQTSGLFSILAIFIACLGLFGLAAYTSEQRTKEIGVRKVLGATVSNIVILLSREFTRLVAISFLVAAPIAYFAANRWLQDFAYRINIPLWSFVLAGMIALLIAMFSVSFQAMKAAFTNPVDALRYE